VVLCDLRAASNAADYLVVAHPELLSEAVRLAEHKAATRRFLTPRVVDIEDVYREFSGGNLDPSALRNFLVYAVNSWSTRPEYVVLLGNGHYDYKQYTTQEVNYIPPYEQGSNCWEDFFTYLTEGSVPSNSNSVSTPDIFLGRLPAASLTEARDMVDKIIEVEGPDADLGAWRNRILLVADDDRQLGEPDPIQGSSAHHLSSEQIERTILRQDSAVDMRKVYLFEYEWNSVYEKPAAARALLNQINNGVAVVNYFGHGSDNVWADERVLRPQSIALLYNRKFYPVFTSFSCSVGRFDVPQHECLSGILVRASGLGGIAALSSTRLAYAAYNEALGKGFYRYAFSRKPAMSIGQAMALSKIENLNSSQKTYCILGDPSFMFGPVTDSVIMETVVGSGARERVTDTLKALQEVAVRGSILRNGGINSAMGTAASPAWVQIGLYNPSNDSTKRKDGGIGEVTYSLPGNPVFIGATQVTAGRFEQRMLLPRRLAFEKSGVALKAYAWGRDSLGTNPQVSIGKGYKGNIIFSGSEATTVGDTTGPRISVRCIYDEAGGNSGGGTIGTLAGRLPLEMEIRVYDESGIDMSGTGPDEGLTWEVPGVFSKRNINHQFLFDQGDYRRGAASQVINKGAIEPGSYLLNISAQDLLGNSTRIQATLEIADAREFRLGQVFNYPNPMRMGGRTRFFFAHTATATVGTDVSVTIKMYTLSGRLVRVINHAINGQEWDGTDQHGRQLSPNVYLYRISALERDPSVEKRERSPVKKLVIYPP
jgi:hypothetical protein